MRYPVTTTGTKEAFKKDWYLPSGGEFGYPRKNSAGVVTYYHEGPDINLNSGGDTDLNQELKAIATGKIVYYHLSKHPNTANTFGRHLVYKIDGAWGTRWVHYAHCSELDFHAGEQDITEGQIIARIGKSGITVAHLHWSIFKVDPATLQNGIDTIPKTLEDLNKYWEDPIAFVDKWMAVTPVPAPEPPVNNQSKYDFGEGYGTIELQAARGIMQDQKTKIKDLENNVIEKDNKIGELKNKLKDGATDLRNLANKFEA